MTDATPSGRYRIDIQAMRAVAVLSVVIYHGGFGLLPGGYLGVDIFFVISGFLMGGIILREADERRFKLSDFYMRRAVRLLPASLCTLLFTTLIASVMLSWTAWQDFIKQLLGSLTFVANYVLMLQTSYFDGDSAMKPLLHMWSLSLEEQFYIFLPIALIIFPRLWRMPALALGMVLSLALCWAFSVGLEIIPISTGMQQDLLFYSLPTRAWELLLGCLAAGVLLRRPNLRISVALSWASLVGIFYVIAFPLSIQHPGIDAIIATLCMTALLFSKESWLPGGIVTRTAQKIGDWSYSIYLVHWPLFAFAANYYLAEPPLILRVALVAASVLLGWLQYRFVEQRFRTDRRQHRVRKAFIYLGATAAVGATGLALTSFSFPSEQRIEIPHHRAGLAKSCNTSKPKWIDRPECSVGDRPMIALWGDSYAMHWNPALAELAGERGLVQITKSACAPILGTTQLSTRYQNVWASDCVAFNDDVLAKLGQRPEIETVIMASPFTQVITPEDRELYQRGKHIPASMEAGLSAFSDTIKALQKAGKKVIVIEPTPSTGIDYGACALRHLSGRPTAASIGDCSFALDQVPAAYEDAYTGMKRITEGLGARYVRPRDVLCRNERCQTIVDGQILYRDTGHLTDFGSRWILDRMEIIQVSDR